MSKLRNAAVVAVMVGSVGMLGAGVAAAGEGPQGLNVVNPQFLNCVYSGNTAMAPVNTATVAVSGNSNASQMLGNVCPQTGPKIGG